jgi:cyclase
MPRKRIIPVILLSGESLVKTTRFSNRVYIGDPCNSVKIFNEFEVDELMVLDINASKNKTEPNFDMLRELASECFMPISYGGGIDSLSIASKVFELGYEKVVVNSSGITDLSLISQLAERFGSQAVTFSLDYRKHWGHRKFAYIESGSKRVKTDMFELLHQAEARGAGEVLLTSIDREGTWNGLDLDTLRDVAERLSIPVIANGGVGSISDIRAAFEQTSVSSVGVGNLFVYQKKGMGVLVHVPTEVEYLETSN